MRRGELFARERDFLFPWRWEPARYEPSYLRLGLSEKNVQMACIGYLCARWRAEVTVVDVGDRRLRAMLRARGTDPDAFGSEMRRGIVDLAVTFPHLHGRAGWFEVKKPAHYVVSKATGKLIIEDGAGEPTEEQLEFLERQHRKNALVGVIWATKDLDAIVAEVVP